MIFNKRRDLTQQHIILKEIFKEKYSELTHDERNEVRQAIFDLEELICNRHIPGNNIHNPYKYIFANASSSIVSDKVLEIIDKLSFTNNNLFINKTRACGITNILVAFTMWSCLNEKPKGKNTIWFVSPNWRMSEECNNKFRKCFSKLGTHPSVCNKKEIEINGWRINFMTTNSGPEIICGKVKPYFIIMDEVGYDNEGKMKFENVVSERYGEVRVIEATTNPHDEINMFVGVSPNQSDNIHYVNVQWFHDLKKCKGLRFERTLNGIVNTIKIDEEDIPTVTGNDDYLYKMLEEGWRLNSDWLDNWLKNCQNTIESVKPAKCETKTELISSISNAVMELCEMTRIKFHETNTFIKIVEFFKDCKNAKDVENMKKRLMVLVSPVATPKKKDDTEAYIKFLKDIFEL